MKKMRILIVSQYFYPENFRINDLALGLKEKGHQITVLTGIPNYPEGKYYRGYGWTKIKERFEGIVIYRVPLVSRGKSKGLRLAINFLTFAISASLLGPIYCFRKEFDAVFVFEISPVTVGIPAIVLKLVKKIPMFLWVLDLWPESLSATEAVQSPRMLKWVEHLVRWIYRHSDRILLASKAFAPKVKALGGEYAQLRYFPNWAEKIFTQRIIEDDRNLPELPPGFRVTFAGNIGAAQDFGTILSAAERLKDFPDIQWTVLGDGRERLWVEEQIRARGLSDRVHLLGKFSLEMMPHFFQQADGLLVTLKKDPIFSLTVPAKIQSYMACGKPIIGALDGEGRKIIEEAQAGFVAPAEDAQGLAASILALYRLSPSERRAMGLKGREYYNENFSREMLICNLENWMEEIIYSGQSKKEGRFA